MSVEALQTEKAERIVGTPLWVRVWHLLVALLFLALVYSGVALTYSRSDFALMDYEFASLLHEVTGIAISVLYVAFIAVALLTGYWRTYARRMRGLTSRMGRPMRRMLGRSEQPVKPPRYGPLRCRVSALKFLETHGHVSPLEKTHYFVSSDRSLLK